MYETLFSPMKIGGMTVKNRTVMAAAEFSLGQPNGKPTERMMDYFEERAKGGAGMIIPGICRVNDMGGASTFTQLAMSHDYHIAPMREFAERLHRHGAKLCIQLHHPGRQGMASATNSLPLVIPVANRFPGVMDSVFKCTPTLLALEEKGLCFSMQAPSRVELAKHGATRMHAMSKKEIHKLVDDFVEAAVRCLNRFFSLLRAERARRGETVLYVKNVEHLTDDGSPGRWHHHFALNATGADYEEIRALWSAWGDDVDIEGLLANGEDYASRARYLCKERPPGGKQAWTP